MERSERLRLEALQRSLKHNLAAIDTLLKTAAKPRLLSNADVRKRAAAICQDVRSRGGTVTKDQLRQITGKHGLPFNTVGSLFVGSYLRNVGEHAALGPRGMAAVGRSKARK